MQNPIAFFVFLFLLQQRKGTDLKRSEPRILAFMFFLFSLYKITLQCCQDHNSQYICVLREKFASTPAFSGQMLRTCLRNLLTPVILTLALFA